MPTVTVYCRGQRVKIPFLERQLRYYDSRYGQGTLKWLCRTTARRLISVRDIAAKLGIKFQTVSVFYCKYVKPHIPEAMRVESFVKPSKTKRLSLPSHLVVLAKRASRHGLAARPIANKCGEAHRRRNSINGWVCRVVRTRPNHPGGYAACWLTASLFDDHDFFIFILRQVDKPTIYYVVPVAELKRLVNGRTMFTVYIPTRGHETYRRRSIAWDLYRSAWHLLKSR